MNRVELVGRLVYDPELRNSNNGDYKFCSFRIAVKKVARNAQGEQSAEFIDVVCFGNLAENLCRYQKRGALIAVEGRLSSRTVTGKDGTNRTVLDVVADNIDWLAAPANSSNQQPQARSGYNSQPNYNNPQGGYNQMQNGYNQQGGYQNPQNGFNQQPTYNNPQPAYTQPQPSNNFGDFGSYQDNFQQPGNNFGQQSQPTQQDNRRIVVPNTTISDDDLPF